MPINRPAVQHQAVAASSRLQVALYTEDARALTDEAAWLHHLVGGLPEVRFRIALLSALPASAAPLPSNASLQLDAPAPSGPARQRPETGGALTALIRAVGVSDAHAFTASLRALNVIAEDGPLLPELLGGSAARQILAAWQLAAQPTAEQPRPRLPAPSVADALALGQWLWTALAPLDRAVPEAQLGHAVGNGAAGLAALCGFWRRGTPFLISEGEVALRQRYLFLRAHPAPLGLKTMQLRFERLLCRAVYRQAEVVVAGSQRVRRWQAHLGAPPGRMVVMDSGLQVAPPAEPAPPVAEAVVVWCGDLRPEHDLETLLRAFDLVRRRRPDARLRLVGQTVVDPGYLARCQALLSSLRLGGVVSLELPDGSQARPCAEAYRAGQVVVVRGPGEEVPAGLLTAMSIGKAIIAARGGGAAQVLGEAGVLSAPHDLLSLSNHLLRLLGDAALRRRLAQAAALQAEQFGRQPWAATYRRLYEQLRRGQESGPAVSRGGTDTFELADTEMGAGL